MRHLAAISTHGYVGGRRISELMALEWASKLLLGQSIGIDETNSFQLKFCFWDESCGRHRLLLFLGVRVDVAYSRNKLRLRLRNLNLESQFSIFDTF